MTYDNARKILSENGQEHLLAFWPKLSAAERKALLAQIATLDFGEVKRMQAILAGKDKPAAKKGTPRPPKVTKLKFKERAKAIIAGNKLLAAGKVGVLLVAGGQGSRLGFDGPKGAFPIGPISQYSLFFFHSRKVLALTRRHGASVPLYVMTSETNHAATVEHFKENEYFGLNPKDVVFFRQGTWPALSDDGKIILDAPGHVFKSPDGHGGTLAALKANGCFEDMKKRGVTTLFYFQVDNPLVEVADPAFIGFHHLAKAQYSLKLCAKRSPTEGLGVVVKRGGRFEMVEYTEMTDKMKNRRTAKGELYFKYGSPAIHVFDRRFLEKEAEREMPLHLAHKKIPFVDAKGKTARPEAPNGWKFEKFIFDCLGRADRVACMAFDRAEEFSPVKNAEGADSPFSCRRDMQNKWRRLFAMLGVSVSELVPFEVDPAIVDPAAFIVNGVWLRTK